MGIFRKKWEFLFLCCFTYMCAYLCRVNLSSALGKMEVALNVSSATLGFLGTAYFFTYACFQLICGFFGDRVRPERLICLGLVGVVSANVGISLSESYPAILALWCINGVFQAMFWGPIARMLAGWFSREERVTVSTWLSLSMPCGYILSWSAIAPLLADSPWMLNFRVPGVVMMIPMVLWLALAIRGTGEACDAPANAAPPSAKTILTTIREERLWLVALGCMSNGVLKESFTIWAPLILTRLLGVNVGESALYLVLFPLCNALFIAGNGRILQRTTAPLRRSLLVIFALVAGCALALMSGLQSVPVTVILLAAISGFGYAANNVYMGILPMGYAEKNITSSLVGIFDFSAYIGAGIAAYGLGLLISGSDLRPIATVWLVAAVVAVVALVFSKGQLAERRETARQNG